MNSGRDLDPTEVFEHMAKGHHARVPNLRDADSYGLGALKALMQRGVFRAMGPVSMAANVTPSLVDLKEGNPNTAAARMFTGMAPAGTGELDRKLMQEAEIADKSPELKDPTYLRTLQNIGQRRAEQGKSPVVESFSGREVDTSATEEDDFLNAVKAKMRQGAQG
jgi:hypothetical protein